MLISSLLQRDQSIPLHICGDQLTLVRDILFLILLFSEHLL